MSDTSSIKDFWCSKKKMTPYQKRSLLRLLKDLRYVKDNPLPTVTAEPEENDLYRWHGNIKGPSQSPLEGGIFHFIMHFPQFYPQEPPRLEFLNTMPHPFVNCKSICLNMLDNSIEAKDYQGWSPQYTVYNILCQLQSFLIDGLEMFSQSTGYNISFSQKQTSQWKIVFENRDQEGEGSLSPSEIRELLLEVGERKPSEEELALFYRMQHIPKDQNIDFSTFLDILKRKREFRKVVESFNRFTCARCSHAPQHPNPNFYDIKPEDTIQKLAIEKIYENETECFFTKRSFQEPDSATLGVGISFLRNPRNGLIHKVFSSIDLVSLNAFRKANANIFPDNPNTFTHWLPVYLNDKHGEKVMHLLPRCLGIICSDSHRDFNPEMIIDIIPKIIGGEITKIISKGSYSSVMALRYYCLFHHLFLVYLQKYPQVRKIIRTTIHKFINDPSYRVKDNIPSLSDFCFNFFVIGSPEEEKTLDDCIDITKLYEALIDEINVRSVLWIVKKHPELDKSTPDEKIDKDRIINSFDSSKAGFKILLMHKFLYSHVALRNNQTNEQSIIDEYNSRFGRPSELQIENIIREHKRIETLPSYDEVYMRLGLSVPDEKELLIKLHNSVAISTKFNYHCKRVITVQSADEYLKEKLQNFVSLQELIDEKESKILSEKLGKQVYTFINDEDRFKKLCSERFGVTDLPEIDTMISKIDKPWQHCYIKLNIEDLLCKFNENPDFKRFYRVVELSAYTLKSLEFTVVPVTNIKSNFHYLTALLTKLWNLENFTVKKGESVLDLKGCKALCKGLKNNPDSLRVLDVHYCHITGDRLKILEEGLLSSKNLLSLNMEGNPIGAYGATSIAKVIRVHTELTHLNVTSCALCGSSGEILADAFYYNKSLKVIKLSKNQISGKGASLIFKNLAYSRTIEEIDFLHNNGDNNSVSIDLTRLFEVSTSLKKINFYKTKVNTYFNANTFHGLAKNRSLTELDLGSSNLGSLNISNLGWAIASNRNLKIIHLEASNIGALGLEKLSEAIYDTDYNIKHRERQKKLRDLTQAEICEDLRPRGCSLEKIDLSQNAFTISSLTQQLALERFIALTTTIIDINLSNCNLSVPAGDALGKGLRNHPSLLKLNLSGNILEEHGIKKLCKGLNENSILQDLDISRNNIGGRGASAVGTLLSNEKCGLTTLNLYGNLIGIEGARFIASSLEVNSTLTDLDLGLNRMRPKGVFALTQALKINKTLKVLRLKQNFINDKTAMELSDVLISQPSIEKLCLAGNKVKDSILTSIVSSLKNCKQPVSIDIATLMEVTQQSRLQKTVYCSPLPQDVTTNALKKMFYDGGCGAIVNVSILKHVTREVFYKACYAFVEFAEEDSTLLALDMGSEGKAKVGKSIFSVIQAQGQTAKKHANKQKQLKKDNNTRATYGNRGRGGRGGRGRGRGRGSWR